LKLSILSNAGRGAMAGGAIVAAGLLAGGCDSYMDPSVAGRWENTPTRVPILTHLAPIEEADPLLVEATDIRADDLIPETESYRVGAGDLMAITIYDLVEPGRPEQLPRSVDQNGYIEIPQLGRIFVAGLTEAEVAQAIRVKMAPLVANPLVSVVVESRQQQTYHLTGAVENPGPYLIPKADYRVYQALIAAGNFPESTDYVYIIRQVPLTPEAMGIKPEAIEDAVNGRQGPVNAQDPKNGENLLDLIDELGAPAPAVVSADGELAMLPAYQPESAPEPLVDLLPPAETAEPNASGRAGGAGDDRASDGARWVFRDGKWVRIQRTGPAVPRQPGARVDPLAEASNLVTQRVIRVPLKPLIAGDARYNIIVRPGDVLRVPPQEQGFVYVDGEVANPGVYALPSIGRLTLTRVITAAGGLGGLAIPSRVDVTRVVGPNEQATIMVDYRAIAEGTQPDIYLKRDDRINIGTNFWATPLAIIRGGFRTNYGFGFLLDRNFGNDVFGAPPTNRNF
jgi:protein involved in polysaccharide export with SLBB domain